MDKRKCLSDIRSGKYRRIFNDNIIPPDQRSGVERRSGIDRRKKTVAQLFIFLPKGRILPVQATLDRH